MISSSRISVTHDVDHVAAYLYKAIGTDGEPLLTKAEATARAEAIVEEVALLGLDLHLFMWDNRMVPGPPCCYPAYEINDRRYDLNSIGPGAKGQYAVNAPGLSCGDLLRFGRACELKRKHLGKQWPDDLRTHLLAAENHLDAVEELMWLGRFVDVSEVVPKVKNPHSRDGLDVDWEFRARNVPFQIEVKNRRGEWSGAVDGSHKNRSHPRWHSAFNGKFFGRDARYNVACVTTYFDVDDDLTARAEELISSNQSVDVLLVWTYYSRFGDNLTPFAHESIGGQIVKVLAPDLREDQAKFIRARFLDRNFAERRVATLQESIERLAGRDGAAPRPKRN